MKWTKNTKIHQSFETEISYTLHTKCNLEIMKYKSIFKLKPHDQIRGSSLWAQPEYKNRFDDGVSLGEAKRYKNNIIQLKTVKISSIVHYCGN
jgi:hypothetical protein